MEPERFRNRNEAGGLLAEKLTAYVNRPDVVVLALPRGGVPVASRGRRAWRTARRLCRAQTGRSWVSAAS